MKPGQLCRTRAEKARDGHVCLINGWPGPPGDTQCDPRDVPDNTQCIILSLLDVQSQEIRVLTEHGPVWVRQAALIEGEP